MVNSTPTAGNLLKGGVRFLHNFGQFNTFLGVNAGNLTMSGASNTGTGNSALFSNTFGFFNTATGASALTTNSSGAYNTATGYQALYSNTNGAGNAASGYQALYRNTDGSWNTASGSLALGSNTTGNRNIAIGVDAGANVVTGSDNIHIGNFGLNESTTIRIGAGGTHTRFFAAGVWAVPILGGVPVVMNADGQFRALPSSRRFKEDVRDMGQASSGLRRLRPVTFYYKQAQQGGPRQLQYGLIAEEVAAVYPELVEYSDSGEPFTVRYHLLGAMLLNEVQRQDRQIQEQAAQIAELQAQLAAIARGPLR